MLALAGAHAPPPPRRQLLSQRGHAGGGAARHAAHAGKAPACCSRRRAPAAHGLASAPQTPALLSAPASWLSRPSGVQELRLEQVQGSGALLAPLAAMPCLQALELASCHLNDAQALTAALCSAFSLEHLRVQVGGCVGCSVCVCMGVRANLAAVGTHRGLGALHGRKRWAHAPPADRHAPPPHPAAPLRRSHAAFRARCARRRWRRWRGCRR